MYSKSNCHTYRTRNITNKAHRTSVTYFLAKIEAYRTVYTSRPSTTGGAYRGRAPQLIACAPQTKIVPPKRGLCPKEINRLGASGVQIEVQSSVLCGLTPDFVTFLG